MNRNTRWRHGLLVLAALGAAPLAQAKVVAASYSGTGDFGLASQPVANVAANDTVGGAPATLGAGGNAVVSKVGTWTTGVGLDPATGAVSTTKTLPVGTYHQDYQICSQHTPSECATGNVTVTVLPGTLTALPVSGTADYGIGSQPIANITATDTVNGVPVVLGSGGNAVVLPSGQWNPLILLNSSTGSVRTNQGLAVGSYSIPYQLCDLNVPKNCAIGLGTVTVIAASILANPVSGVAATGISSTPIANLVSSGNDTVDGAVPTLGAGGNAQLATVGTWPSGISLNATTGAVTVAATVKPSTYDMQYQLCDHNAPPNCAISSVEIDVTPSIVANAQSGVAPAGLNSTPIADVAKTDTVYGQPARLQTSPNATVATVGTWPAGIALNTKTGAVTAASTVPTGAYEIQYLLCAIATKKCADPATDTISVDASVIAAPIAGSAVVGTAGVPIPNLVAHGLINGVAANLNPKSGNATLSAYGNPWPPGIALNTKTGEVTTTTTLSVGNYQVQYQLCNRLSPPTCATAKAGVSITPAFVETPMTQYATGDLEFDWGRDGLFCRECNFGSTNAQVNWTDPNNNLWVSGIDPVTGAFTPLVAQGIYGVPVDNTAAFWQDFGNGPEWAFSTPAGAPDGMPVSQLVYTRYDPNGTRDWEHAGAAIATQTGPAVRTSAATAPWWTVEFFPGAYTAVQNPTNLPEASQCPSDPASYAVFEDLIGPTMFTEAVNPGPGQVPQLTPFGAYANNIGERWAPCTTWLTFQDSVTIGTQTLQQVYWYDRVTMNVQQMTYDPTTKQRALMFRAPEFGGAWTLMALSGDNAIQIYVQQGTSTLPSGAPKMSLVNTIYSPDPGQPWMFDPKAFIHCTAAVPTCSTFIVMGMSAVPQSQNTETSPNGLGVTSIDPNNPFFEVLVTAGKAPATQRLDPKYYITQNGPIVYYSNFTALTTTTPYQDNGIYSINMNLGAPFGPCVGSSAHEGLNPTWPNCTPGVPPGASRAAVRARLPLAAPAPSREQR